MMSRCGSAPCTPTSWPVRKAAVARQQAALEHWSQHASAAQRQTLDQRFQTLECAEADADAAAYKLLYRERALDLVTLNREFTALHGAHKKPCWPKPTCNTLSSN